MTEPVSIRYKNPGAMWGNALAIKWGASPNAVVLHDGKGQGNNIAVFPTYVQGICAQLDLWRTSKHYRNKRFADAIAVWSGGNDVESYIHFVTSRVPGMTRDTIMDDTFWKSSKGIAFLKAQAWHEAGKQYPAPDADWIEAQRRVFSGAVPRPAPDVAPPNAQPVPAASPDAVLWDVQTRLKARRYSPGLVDGFWGSGTRGALSGFMNDRGMTAHVPISLAEFHDISDQVEAELLQAETEQQPDGSVGWYRPVSQARANADPAIVKEIAPEVVQAEQGRTLTIWGMISAAVTAVYRTFSDTISNAWDFLFDHKDDIPTDPTYLQSAWGFVTSLPSQVWLFAGAIGFAYVAIKMHGVVKKINEDVKTGTRQ